MRFNIFITHANQDTVHISKVKLMWVLIQFFPLFRYRNFRTFTTPQAVQFSCLCVDNSGEVVCAGSLDTFEIFVWCMKTGRLIEVYLHFYLVILSTHLKIASNTNYD